MSPSSSPNAAGGNRRFLLVVVPLLLLAIAVWFWRGQGEGAKASAAAPDAAQAEAAGGQGGGDPKAPVVAREQIEAAGAKPQPAAKVELPPRDLPQLPLVDTNVERTKDMEILKVVLPQSAPSFIACVGRHALKPGTIEPGLHALIQVGPGPAGKSIVTGLSFAGGKEPPEELATCLRGALTTVSFDLPAGTNTIIETPPLLGEAPPPAPGAAAPANPSNLAK